MKRLDVMRQWSEGFAAALYPGSHDATKGEHWMAGYSAGYKLRAEKNRLLDEYLVSTGRKPQVVLRTCEARKDA